ncbi:NIPSNAP family protein [Cyclobacterium amurskyense]|uniref:NIPSNAP family containing protein n=1 Tax=Cyclobacterium amurskyense TaxID=320787 RepID=A0A0H4PJA4_9BACT|nr:NIPSNAP family protein [Cyclobacterium amurskyense]AKP54214.1 NIPSNAP family containing protein [Cyclobacterium amurskyense]|tara:strand:+ start:56476 stop:57267 length:792 start_codon:yes stop_codon:yes gene_type:complete
MNNYLRLLKVFTLVLILIASYAPLKAQDGKKDLYELRVYHIDNLKQIEVVENYLEKAFIPAAHRAGVKHVGVFKPLASEPDAGKKIYVFLPFTNSKDYFRFQRKLKTDARHQEDGKAYIQAAFDNPSFNRIETSLMQAFETRSRMALPKLSSPKSERVYELRSYESATERLYHQKVKMFNEGEIDIFDEMNFNGVFYGEPLAGANMPNLVYMTAFENMEDRDAHWAAFSDYPAWLALKANSEYDNTVSKNDKRLLRPTSYSDF